MFKSNTRILIFGLSVIIILVLLAIFAAGFSRFSIPALAQPNRSNILLPQQPDKSQRGPQDAERKRQEFVARVPTTDYDAPEPTSPAEKLKRRNRNKHYDGKNLVMSNPSNSGSATILDSELFFDLPALPVHQSDVILTADVLNSEAHLSNDKTGVYSEFNVQVDAVLKGSVPTLSQTNLLSISRTGGMVRYASGHKELYQIAHQNMPAMGKQYLFFLKAIKDTEDYEIVTAYEIGSTSVQPLDFGAQFQAYSGTDSVVFLNAVRESIFHNN